MSVFRKGRKATITNDSSHHGFEIGTKVYLISKEIQDYPRWLCSEDPNADLVWADHYSSGFTVMPVKESDLSVEEPMAEGEKELLNPGSTSLALDPSKVKAGDTVTLERDVGLAKVEGTVERVSHGAGTHMDIRHLNFTFIVPTNWILTAHQPAPEPEHVTLPTGLYSQIMVTYIGMVKREERHCVLVQDTDGVERWLILSRAGKAIAEWHSAAWLESAANRKEPLYEIKVLHDTGDAVSIPF